MQAATGNVLWRASCAPLGVAHSKYSHRAIVTVKGSQLRVASRGSGGDWVEIRDLGSGS
jgi:hypothetical protein